MDEIISPVYSWHPANVLYEDVQKTQKVSENNTTISHNNLQGSEFLFLCIIILFVFIILFGLFG